jgi:hypothetical protein
MTRQHNATSQHGLKQIKAAVIARCHVTLLRAYRNDRSGAPVATRYHAPRPAVSLQVDGT